MKTPLKGRSLKGSLPGLLLLILIWILIALYQREIQDKPFPYPWEAVQSIFITPAAHTALLIHAGVSLLRWIGGYGIALIAGISWGIAIWRFPLFQRLTEPLVSTIQLIPGMAWIPITLILFGLGNGSTIFMIAMTSLPPVVVNTFTGMQQLDPGLLKIPPMLELTEKQRLTRIIIPGALPSIIGGLRIGAGNGFRVLISAEMVVGSSLGLGYSMFQSRWTLDYASAFGALLLIIVIGLIFEQLIFLPLEHRILEKRGL
ncbi:MAG: ABC transporter permease subunit [Spirochaetales bacterium]|nr:ABC transporter permease subunit [Spirochaetales bacterium]